MREIRVFKIELMVVDHDGIGEKAIRHAIEESNYPNDCIMPSVMNAQSKPVIWNDFHELNRFTTRDKAFRELFAEDGELKEPLSEATIVIGVKGTTKSLIYNFDPSRSRDANIATALVAAEEDLKKVVRGRHRHPILIKMSDGQEPDAWVNLPFGFGWH